MSNPVKSPAKDRFTELSVADTRLIVYGSICFNGPKLDTEKLARLAGMKPVSAGSNYLRARRRLEKILGEEAQDSSASPTKDKFRAPAKRKTGKKAPQAPHAGKEDTDSNDSMSETLLTTPATKRRKSTTLADEYFEAEVPIIKDEPKEE